MLLAATAEGLGSVVHIPVKKEPEQIKEFLKVPDGWALPALVVLGYAVKGRAPADAGQGDGGEQSALEQMVKQFGRDTDAMEFNEVIQ